MYQKDIAMWMESEFAAHTELRRRLLELEPDLDEITLLDTLEGMTNLNEAIAEVVRSALIDAAYVAGLKGRIEEMQGAAGAAGGAGREQAGTGAGRRWRKPACARIVAPDFTITLRASPTVAARHRRAVDSRMVLDTAAGTARQAQPARDAEGRRGHCRGRACQSAEHHLRPYEVVTR